MPTEETMIVAYCSDNSLDALGFISQLESKGLGVRAIELDTYTDKGPINTLKDFRQPIYLIISDNFLRSYECMKDGKSLLSEFYIPQELRPIILRGTYNLDKGPTQYVDTKFERVGDVIAYMNYWQEIYLQLKEESKLSGVKSKKLVEHKKIANEIGDFLGILRTSPYLDFEEESKNGFQTILDRFGILPTMVTSLPNDEKATDDALDQTKLDKLEEARQLLEEEEMEDRKRQLELIKEANLVDKVIAYKEKNSIFKNGSHNNDPEEDDMATLDRMADEIEQQQKISRLKPYEELIKEDQKMMEMLENDNEVAEANDILDSEENPEEMIDVETGITDVENQDKPTTDFEDFFHQPKESIETEKDSIHNIKQLVKDNKIELALEELKKLIQSNPNNLDLQHRFAKIMVNNKGDHYKATQILEQILEQDSEYVKAYYLLAQIAENHQDFLLAKSYYEKVINLDKKFPNIHFKIGSILRTHFPEQEKAAAKYFKKAIALDPRSSEAYYQLGLIKAQQDGKYKKAIKKFRKCLKIKPLHPMASFEIAKLYAAAGKAEKAKSIYKSAVKNNAELDKPEFRNELGLQKKKKDSDIFDIINEEQKIVRNNNQLDETVLITGATSGIGKATAILFAQKGYRLILTGRRTDRLESLKKELRNSYDIEVKTLQFDVRDLSEGKKMLTSLPKAWSNIDILINNAGLALGLSPIQEGNIDNWETMIDTNIKGLLYMTRAIAPSMVKRKSGHIINICSTAGKEVYPNGNVYCATKHAVDALTKAMRVDLYKHNIKVSQISPAHVEETEFSLVRFDGDEDKSKIYDDFNPLKATDVADAIFYIINRPAHVNIQDVIMMGTQQANSNHINRIGRIFD